MATEINITPSTKLTVGTTAIASGTIGRVLFQGTGNVLQQSAGLSFATANNQLNIGTSTYLRGGTNYTDSFANGWGLYNCGLQSTLYGNSKDIWNVNTLSIGSASASARLDVKAAGALSTDLAFRVRNSADTVDILKVQGDGNVVFSGDTTSNRFLFGDGFLISGGANIARYAGTALIKHRFTNNGTTSYFEIDPANGLISTNNGMNYLFGTGTGTKLGTATTQKIGFWNATPIVQPTTAVAASTFVANTSLIANDTATFDGYTLGQIVKALRNTGILA